MTDAELVATAALERQISELTNKNCELQEKLDEYENAYKFIMDDKCFNEEKHCACAPILRAKVKELEAENAMLRKQVEQKLKIEQLDCLRRIRDAVGDNGKMMQDELVDHIADLSKMVETLRKRLEPIESAHREYEQYPSSAIVKRNAFDGAEGGGMMVKIREQKLGEDRRDYMLLVAARYIREHWDEGIIFYDDAECDGNCVADDCEIASESVEAE